MALLALNAGSATLKAAWFEAPGAAAAWRGHVDLASGALDAQDGLGRLLASLARAGGTPAPRCVVHRVVHGGTRFSVPVVVDDGVARDLADLAPLAPLHQPASLAAMAAARAAFPGALHVACFDTAFHAGWADAARRFALPRRLHEQGIRRYGFHGLAHAFAARSLRASLPHARRAVVAHLGGGSSLCALADFASVECSMGFSPLDGLPMATRCGALDPGVLLELAGPGGLSPAALSDLLYRESGLLGVSGVSGDMRELLASEATAARQAVDLYVHHLVRGIGAMAATLGGLDALAFSGGIGEHAAPIRALACARLAFLGVVIDGAANAANAPVLESAASRVAVRIVASDEQAELAREAFALIARAGVD